MPKFAFKPAVPLLACALTIVLAQGVLWGEALGFGLAIEDWERLGGGAGAAKWPSSWDGPWDYRLHFLFAAILGVLALLLLHDLSRSVPAALLGALALATLPDQARGMLCLDARPILLQGVLGLAMLAGWARFRLTGRKRLWALALGCHAAALALGPAGLLGLPLLVLVDLFLFTGASRSLRLDVAEVWRCRWRLLPFLAVALGFAWFEFGAGDRGAVFADARQAPEFWRWSAATAAASLCGGIAVLAAVAGRTPSECYREGRLALLGVTVLAAATITSCAGSRLLPGLGAGVPTGIGLALVWCGAGLATLRAATQRAARLGVLAAAFGSMLALHAVVVRSQVHERVRQDQLAREVQAATLEVLPRLVEPLSQGRRLRPEFAPLGEAALRAMVARLSGAVDPGIRVTNPSEDLVLRWRGSSGWALR